MERVAVGDLPLFVVRRRLPSGNLVEVYGLLLVGVKVVFDSCDRLPAACGPSSSGGEPSCVMQTSFLTLGRFPLGNPLAPAPSGVE